ncbi:S24 family peptidase [Stutzerimonas nitrititolerans]|uniref:S24 family peptidase n=1 Tax=Stutzerimonas nitrititolerans TaxID=2482751 RepID=UPI00289EDB70|nr:S24 family peptidase [Stutzerimonas nitrititolerans]
MLTGSELGAAIEAARIKKNVSKKAFGDAFGIKPPSVQGWVKTGRIDKSKLIEVIRYFSDVVGPEHWGLASDDADLLNLESAPEPTDGKADSAADAVLRMLEKHGKGLPDEARQMIISAAKETPKQPASNVITADFSRPGPVGDEIRIAHYDVQGAMGNGKLVHDYPEMFRDVTVSQRQLRDLGVTYKDPAHLKIISGDGQSMSPIIQHLDPMISDVSIREYTGDGIYAFTWQGHFYIKSLQIADEDHFLMVSANETLYPPKKIRIDDTYIQARILLVWKATRV